MLIQRHVLAIIALVIGQVSCANPGAKTESPSTRDGLMAQEGASPPLQIDAVPAASNPPLARAAESTTADPETDGSPVGKPITVRGTDRVIAPSVPKPGLEGPESAFKFEETPIADVVHLILGQILKVDYVLHKPLTGTVTLSTKSSVSADQAVALLEGALQANGLLMARDSRGVYHVGRAEALKGIVSAPRQVGGGGPLPPGYGTVIVPLENIGAAEMATILRPMISPEALIRVDTLRNLLILVGTRNQVEGWLEMVSTFDIDLLKGMSIGVFPLKYASIRDVESTLRMITPGAAAASGTGGSGGVQSSSAASGGLPPAASTADTPSLLGGVRLIPIERINSIIVVTPKAARLEDIRRWIERLDQPTNSAESQLFVYPVQNGSAQHLAKVLNGIFGTEPQSTAATESGNGVSPGLSSVTSGQGAQLNGGFGYSASGTGNNSGASSGSSRQTGSGGSSTQTVTAVALGLGTRLIADNLNNAILVYGSRSDYKKIEDTLRKLDIPPIQVLIEASIIEVTLNDDLRYGVQWLFNDSSSGSTNGTGVLSTGNGGVLGGPLAGFSYTLRNSLGNVRAVLNTLAEKSLVKVISSPSLMVLDNHTASIAVGNQQPVRSGETVSTGGFATTTIQYKDTGVSLAVTPSVNAGNIVTMQINQGVTDVGQVDTATGQRTFLQRRIDSKVAIRSGETLVLGGLIRDNTTTGKSGIPLLQDIPVVGALFGSNNTNKVRTELLVVITPRVVRSDQEVRDVSGEMRQRMKSFSAIEDLRDH
ncbi:MAG: type II secretion system secretin GspD [Pseudomonadota bacterium]|nr:type II secretion system secretin GspD [Pseudomonadota bacterium]